MFLLFALHIPVYQPTMPRSHRPCRARRFFRRRWCRWRTSSARKTSAKRQRGPRGVPSQGGVGRSRRRETPPRSSGNGQTKTTRKCNEGPRGQGEREYRERDGRIDHRRGKHAVVVFVSFVFVFVVVAAVRFSLIIPRRKSSFDPRAPRPPLSLIRSARYGPDPKPG